MRSLAVRTISMRSTKKDWHECQSLNMLQAHAEKISIVSPSARVTMAFFQVRV